MGKSILHHDFIWWTTIKIPQSASQLNASGNRPITHWGRGIVTSPSSLLLVGPSIVKSLSNFEAYLLMEKQKGLICQVICPSKNNALPSSCKSAPRCNGIMCEKRENPPDSPYCARANHSSIGSKHGCTQHAQLLRKYHAVFAVSWQDYVTMTNSRSHTKWYC